MSRNKGSQRQIRTVEDPGLIPIVMRIVVDTIVITLFVVAFIAGSVVKINQYLPLIILL
jgi:hypothetical protein